MAFRVTAAGLLPGGEEWMNVYHFTGTVVQDDQVLDDAFSAVLAFYDAFNDRLVDSWSLTRLSGGNAGGPTLREDEVTGLTGEVATAPMPNDLSVLVTWLTAVPSRRGRGRTFLGGWPLSAAVENGTNGASIVDGGPVGAVSDAATALIATPDVNLAVYSRPAPDADPPRPVGSESAVTGGNVSRRWSTQRRRDLETPRLLVSF